MRSYRSTHGRKLPLEEDDMDRKTAPNWAVVVGACIGIGIAIGVLVVLL